MIGEARNSSRRCTIVTLLANFVRNVASSIAVSPPPTTTSSRSRKKKPSQVAHALTPRPRSFSSPGTSSHFALAPVATMSVFGSPFLVAGPDAERAAREVDARDVHRQDLRAEPLGLLLHLLHQLGAEDAVGEAGVVLDVGREHQLPAGARGPSARAAPGWRGRRRGRPCSRPAPTRSRSRCACPSWRIQSSHRRKHPPIPETRCDERSRYSCARGRGYSCAEEKERIAQSVASRRPRRSRCRPADPPRVLRVNTAR